MACSLFFLSAPPGIISFTFCCLLMFTDLLVTGRRPHRAVSLGLFMVHAFAAFNATTAEGYDFWEAHVRPDARRVRKDVRGP